MTDDLTFRERLRAWFTPKEQLQAEIKDHQRRLRAMQNATNEAVSYALQFENSDITDWLQRIASTDKGALGIQVRELEQRNKELEARHTKMVAAVQVSDKTLAAVLEAWERAAGVRGDATWDKVKGEWIVTAKDSVLPPDVLDALNAWINRDVRKRKAESDKAK